MPRHPAIKIKRVVKSRTPEKSEQDNGEGNSANAGYWEIPVQHPSIDVYELACKMGDSSRSVLQTVMDRNEDTAADMDSKLGTLDVDPVRAVSILKALGISDEMQPKMCSEISAFWRVRIALARVLYLYRSPLVFGDHLDSDERAKLEKELKAEDKMKHETTLEAEPPLTDEESKNLTVCCICQQSLLVTHLPICSHAFHHSCAVNCFKENKFRTCPLCQKIIPLEQLQRYGVKKESTSALNRVPTPFPFDTSDESNNAMSRTSSISNLESLSTAATRDVLRLLNLSPPRSFPRTVSPRLSRPIVFSGPELSHPGFPSPGNPHGSPPRCCCSPFSRNPPPPNSPLLSPQRVSSTSRRLPLESSSARRSPFSTRADPSNPTGTIPSSRSDSIARSLVLQSSLSPSASPFFPRADPSYPAETIPSSRSDSISRRLPFESSSARTSPSLPRADPSYPTETIPSSRRSDSISISLPLEYSARTSSFLSRADSSYPTSTILSSRGSHPESVPISSLLRSRSLRWLQLSVCPRSMPRSSNSSPPRSRES